MNSYTLRIDLKNAESKKMLVYKLQSVNNDANPAKLVNLFTLYAAKIIERRSITYCTRSYVAESSSIPHSLGLWQNLNFDSI